MKLWGAIRSKQLEEFKFRRQLPLGHYIADFCCLEKRLVIELDGSQHAETRHRDEQRTKFLEREGFKIIRIWNHEVLSDLESVLELIRQTLNRPPSPQPSPLKGEGVLRQTLSVG